MTAARALTLAALLPGAPVLAHPFHQNLEGLASPSPATILLITPPELEEAWQSFADWKAQTGKPVRILTTTAIDERYEGADLQDKIRRCVRNHVDHFGTWWIVLGGDSQPGGQGAVPHRDTAHKRPDGTVETIPTDLYYLSSKDWDSDDDGIYGEWDDDRESISYPDGTIGLGRVPVRTPAEVQAFTEKVIGYETRYPDADFATRMVYTCPVPGAYPKLRASWDRYIAKVFAEGSVTRFFADETPWDDKDPGDYALSPSHLVKLINDRQAGKLHIHGHGTRSSWVLEADAEVTAANVAQLSNKDAYPVITTVSCFTGQFDSAEDPCIAESMLRQPAGGAVAIVAPSREGKPHFHDPARDMALMVSEGKLDGTTFTMTRFWTDGLGKNLTLGEALGMAKASLAEDAAKSAAFHLCLCELNLLGDPTLPFRSTNPRRPKLLTPKSLEAGNISLIIETDAPGSLVALQGGHGLTYLQVADETGLALFPLTVRKDTELTVTVSGPNLNAVSTAIPVK